MKFNLEERHVISIIVDNEFGALARVVSLFSARGYNIETLSVSSIDKEKKRSRITITTFGSQEVIDLIIKLLNRIIPVHEAIDLTESGSYVEKECALIKVKITNDTQEEILRIAHTQKATLLSKTKGYYLLEITDGFSRVRSFIDLLEPFGIIEISRTGYAALAT